MIADWGLFVGIAEIAGVFVAFAALISVTGRDEMTPAQLSHLRAVVSIGLVVVVAALIPVGLDAYGPSEAVLWRVSSIVFLGIVWAVGLLSLRYRENRRQAVTQARTSPAVAGLYWGVLEVAIQVPLVLNVIGAFSGQAPAFYTTALIVHLFEAAVVLAQFVYAGVTPSPRSSDGADAT